MDGDKIRHQERADELLLGRADVPGVDHHGQAGGDALVAGAGEDDHGHLTAAHPGIGPGSRVGLGPLLDVVAVVLQQYPSDLRAPGTPQPLLGDGGVLFDLPQKKLLHSLQRHRIGKADDVLHVEAALVGHMLLGGVHHRQIPQDLAVALHMDDVGMVVGDAHPRRVVSGNGLDVDVQLAGGFAADHVDIRRAQEVVQGRQGLRGKVRNDLQIPVRVPCHHARSDGGTDALAPSGVGDHHAFDVFQNVAADGGRHPLRQLPQELFHGGGAVGDGDRLGAARGRDQFLAQNGDIVAHDILFQHCLSILSFSAGKTK